MSDGSRDIHITGGTFDRSMFANGDIYASIAGDTQNTLADLRGLLREHRAELAQADPRVAGRLDQLTEDLAEREPDPEAVRSGWRNIAKIVAGAGVAAESAKQITELVQQLFGG
jgi:hypothetical protein